MKYLLTFFAVFALGFATVAYSQTNPPPAAPKTLPANIKSELEAALAKTNKDDGKALAKVAVKAAKKYSSMVPEIAADAVAFVANALKNDPATAQKVIPQIIAALTKANPSLTGAIVTAALGGLPPDLRAAIAAPIAQAVIAAVPDKKEKAAALNAALIAVGDNPGLLQTLDQIALDNKIGITQTTQNGTTSQRYFVDENPNISGDQGTLSVGQVGPSTGPGGGPSTGPTNPAGNQPSTPTPTPTPTPIPTPVSS